MDNKKEITNVWMYSQENQLSTLIGSSIYILYFHVKLNLIGRETLHNMYIVTAVRGQYDLAT